MVKEENNKNELEDTTEIEVGDADIGKFNIVVYIIIIICAVTYFFTDFTPS